MNWGNIPNIRSHGTTIDSSRFGQITTNACDDDFFVNSGHHNAFNLQVDNGLVGTRDDFCTCGNNLCGRSTSFIVGGKSCCGMGAATTIIGNMSLSTKSITIEVTKNTTFTTEDTIDTILPIIVRPRYYPRSIEIAGIFHCPQNVHLDGLTLRNICIVVSSNRAKSCNTTEITNCKIIGDETYIVNEGGTLKMIGNTFDSKVLCRPVVDHVCGETEICNNCGDIDLCKASDEIPMFTYQRADGMLHVGNTFTFTGDEESVVFGVDPGVKAEHHDSNYYHECKLFYHAVVEDTKDDDCCYDSCYKPKSYPNKITFGESDLHCEENLYKHKGCKSHEPKAILFEGFQNVSATNTTCYLDVITTGLATYKADNNSIDLHNTVVFTSGSEPAITVNIPDVALKIGLFGAEIHNKCQNFVIEYKGNGDSKPKLSALSGSMLSEITTPQAYTLTGIPDVDSLLANGPFSLVGVVPYVGNSPNEPVDILLDT